VLDQAGKAIPNAAVTVKDEATGTTHKLMADSDGKFSAAGLAAGSYSVEVTAAGFATATRTAVKPGADELSISLGVASLAQAVTVEATVSLAAQTAPVQASLEARSAVSEIPQQFVDNFVPPTADYSEVTLMAPGTFSVNPNGAGLGDSKTFYRGFKDGDYTMTFDGIPFEDTNSPTHHSWVFFPGQWIGGTNFDRSPGSASTIGPTNFGGSINLLSRQLAAGPDVRGTISYGSFNTRLLGLDFDSGQVGKSNLTIDLHQMLSDGYQTYNYQKRVAGSMKYQYRLSAKTTLTAWVGIADIWTNTPNTKGPTRAQVAQFGDNFLMSGDPTSPLYYGLNFYHVQSDFGYVGIQSDLGHGWKLDDKVYFYRYWNKQNYNNSTTTVSATSGVDKLNGYSKPGDILTVSHESTRGIFRTGIWFEWAYTDRYQIPNNPKTLVNQPWPNFHEHFITQTYQPFAEYEYRVNQKLSVRAGVKFADYGMHLNQFADNGKTIGCPGGVLQGTNCVGGVQFVTHDAWYTSVLPSADIRYKWNRNWTLYAQFAEGSEIPPSSVFDVKNASVSTLPKPTLAKTYQTGTIFKVNRLTLDFDFYYIHFQNPYVSTPDPSNANEPIYYLPGPSNTKGVEAEANVYVGAGFSVYLNGTVGAAKYQNTGLWVASAPQNTEAFGLTYQHKNWDFGFFDKRIGHMWNDNGPANQAIPIDPFSYTNLYFNYTMRGASYMRGTKIRFGINNLLDRHSITGVTAASTASNAPNAGDQLQLLPARSFSITFTPAYAPKQ
jgi:iron complex outermembrane receptor protein